MKNIALKVLSVFMCAMLSMSFTFSVEAVQKNEATLGIPVENILTGSEPEGEYHHFYFTISSENGPLPDDKRIIITESGKKSFGEIVFDVPGIYSYIVKEEIGSDGDVKYDSTVYDVAVVVMNKGDHLEAYVAAIVNSNTGYKVTDGLIFNNEVSNGTTGEHTDKTNVNTSNSSDKTNSNVKPGNPDTGDNSGIETYILLMIVSGIGIGAMVISYFKRKEQSI